MGKIIERFDKYMAHKELNDNKVTVQLGLSNGLLGKSRKSDRDLSKHLIEKILKFYVDINPSWLLTGEGDMLRDRKIISTANIKQINQFVNVPLVQVRAMASYIRGHGDFEYVDSLPSIPVFVDKNYKGRYVCFEIDGDSMDDGSRGSLCDRDIVLCRQISSDLWKHHLHIQDWYFVIVHRDGVVCKNISYHDVATGDITCHSLNPLYDDYIINLTEVIELYNVIKVVDRVMRL